MKYLFIVLFCYAVKCEDVRNNYFVVKMPEDIQQQDVKDFKKPFQVYWNVPTMQCTSKKIPFQNLYEKFGIIQNDNDRFIGNKIVVIYNEINFPAIINNKTSGKNVFRNGGVPQEGNLENHLFLFEQNLNDKIPDPYFDGIAVIDFESWRPVFRQNFGSLLPHRSLSLEIEKRLHNWWPKMWIEREATLRFETAARKFMQATLSMANEIRPNALWGYYGFPYCFNMRGRDMAEKCATNIDKENDSIYWLWAESTALFPSLYSSVSLSSSQLSSLIMGRVKEASRVRGVDTPIFPYFWYRYRDAGFITEKDLEVALAALYQSNASGFIMWGSSNDVNTVDKCKKLFKYVETVLGPNIAKYTKPMKKIHNDHVENEEIYTMETSTVSDGLFYSRSTQSLNTDKLLTTETDYNKFTKADESPQTSNNDEMSSTESFITYNDYTNNDDSHTLHDFDLVISSLESSTIRSEFTNTNQNIQTLNNEEISSTETATAFNKRTNNDKNSQSLNYDDLLSSETFKTYSTFTNSDQSTATPNYDEISLAKISTSYNSNAVESSQTPNIDISKNSTPNVYEYSDSEKNVASLIIADLISLSEPSAIDYKYSDSTTSLNNDEMSLLKILSTDNIYRDKKSQSLDVSNEETTIDYYKHSETKENVYNLSKDDVVSSTESPTIYNENRDYITTTLNYDEMYLSRISTFSNNNRDRAQSSNDHMSNEETTIVYNEYSETETNVPTSNNVNVMSASDSSTICDENGDNITTTFNNDEMSLSKITTIDNSYRDESSQTSNNYVSNKETTAVYNDYSITDDNLHTLNNNQGLSSNVSSTIFDENRDHSTFLINNDEMSTTDTVNLYNKYVNTDQNKETTNDKEIPSKGTSTIYDHFFKGDENVESLNNIKYLEESSPPSDEVNYTDKSTYLLTDSETITEENEFESTDNDFHNNNILFNFSEDRYDYLIKVEGSTNVEALKQFEYQNSTNVDDDYLIIVQNENDQQNLGENMTNNKIDTVFYTTQTDKKYETETESESFAEAANNLDLVVTYIDKEIGIKRDEELTTKVESLHSSKISHSGDGDRDRSDYLIIVDNSTNIETYNQSENRNLTNGDNDYLIIVPDFNYNNSEKGNILDNNLILDTTIQEKADLEIDTKVENYDITVEDLDPIVAYINKTIDYEIFQDSMSPGDESFNNKLPNSDGEASDYLIKLVTSEETDKQYENTESTVADDDYIIIIKNLDDFE